MSEKRFIVTALVKCDCVPKQYVLEKISSTNIFKAVSTFYGMYSKKYYEIVKIEMVEEKEMTDTDAEN